MYAETRMIAAQADLITKLNGHIQELHAENDRLRAKIARTNKAAEFYLSLQSAIMKSDVLQAQWVDFIMVAKLAGVETEGVDLPNIERPW